MTVFLIILVVLAAIATVVALVRGIVVFLRTTEADLKGEGVSGSGLRQNRMMMQRVTFQAAAVLLAALALLLSR